jgi:hypothetical protein
MGEDTTHDLEIKSTELPKLNWKQIKKEKIKACLIFYLGWLF